MTEIIDAVESFQQYLLAEKGLSKQTVTSYTTDLKQFFSYFYVKKYIEEYSGDEIREFLEHEVMSAEINISTTIRHLSPKK